MKKFKLFILCVLLYSCGTHKYVLNDINKTDKKHLTEYISKKNKTEEIGKNPLILIDGKPFRHDVELKSSKLNISKNNIEKLDIISKKPGLGKLIWGEYANDGVILVMTNLVPKKEPKKAEESDIIYFIDGIKVDESKIKSLNNNDIQTIQVFKSNNRFLLFDGTEIDGFIFIHMK